MKNKYRLLKIILTIGILVFLLNFSLKRFRETPMESISVNMIYPEGEKVYFIDEKAVVDFVRSKNPSGKVGDINIPQLERQINQFPSVDSANVYMNLNGKLNVDISQKIPAFRLSKGGNTFYVDTKCREFPISKNYSESVMLVAGNVGRGEYQKIINLVRNINEDEFSRKYFVGVKKQGKDYHLLTGQGNFSVEIGNLENIDFKLKGFKAFVEKFLIYQHPQKYNKISLKFNNQIVTTLNPRYREIDEALKTN